MNAKSEKRLVVYFSHAGENYSNGSIVVLKKGNTEIAAEMAAELAGAELFEIRPKKEYPHDYKACVEAARQELGANARPELCETPDIGGYDTIFLGYPSWCGTMPMPVFTFLEGQKLDGKVILPFCTNEGSGMGASTGDLKKLCPGADIRAGLPIHGSSVSGAKPEIEKWIKQNLE